MANCYYLVRVSKEKCGDKYTIYLGVGKNAFENEIPENLDAKRCYKSPGVARRVRDQFAGAWQISEVIDVTDRVTETPATRPVKCYLMQVTNSYRNCTQYRGPYGETYDSIPDNLEYCNCYHNPSVLQKYCDKQNGHKRNLYCKYTVVDVTENVHPV